MLINMVSIFMFIIFRHHDAMYSISGGNKVARLKNVQVTRGEVVVGRTRTHSPGHEKALQLLLSAS